MAYSQFPVGAKFGDLTVIREAPPTYWRKYKKKMACCRCACGKFVTVRLEYLRNGHTKSCGCHRKTICAKTRINHGLSNTRLHGIWAGMLTRCRNRNSKSYADYGGRGISVCDDWAKSFKCFYDWSCANGYADDLSIDRIDNDGDYQPGNCRWATRLEQRHNRRDTRCA